MSSRAWTLADAEERNRQYPDTFHIRPRMVRETLLVGDRAKLAFEDEEGGDRMWVEILPPDVRGKYKGKLLNQPVCISGLNAGNTIYFGPEHILDVHREGSGLLRRGLVPSER